MESKKFIEILNWEKYQENIPKKNASWHKRHHSLINCEAYLNLEYKHQVLLDGLWDLASQVGPVFKADKKYLFRNIPFIKDIDDIDLDVLVTATDDFGRSNPFIRYVDSPVLGDKAESEVHSRNTASASGKSSSRSSGRKKDLKHIPGKRDDEYDPLLKTAEKIAAYQGFISARKLQLKLRIGYFRANCLIDDMKEKGLLGDYLNGRGYEYLTALENCNTDKSREEKNGILTDSGKEKEERKEKTDLNTKTETNQEQKENPQAEAQRRKQELMQAEAQNSAKKSANPLNPKESDAGAASMHHVPKQPQTSFRGGKPNSIGHIISGAFPEHWRDGDCEQFGWEIVEALGYSTDRQDAHSRAEWGAFAAWWSRLKKAVPSVVYEELREIAVTKAKYVRNKGKSARNLSAVWFKIMEGELASRGISLPDVRASPIISA